MHVHRHGGSDSSNSDVRTVSASFHSPGTFSSAGRHDEVARTGRLRGLLDRADGLGRHRLREIDLLGARELAAVLRVQ